MSVGMLDSLLKRKVSRLRRLGRCADDSVGLDFGAISR